MTLAMDPTTRSRLGCTLAILMAGLGWSALGIELRISLADSFSKGLGWPEAIYLYLRFFTILANLGSAILMTTTALVWLRQRPLPPAPLYGAALAYMLVTGVTYELLLRRLWSPHGIQFLSDMTMHDIVPTLTLLFWLGFAPREGAHRRDPLWMMIFPLAYFSITLVAGARGAGYPYDFLDAARLGYGRVFVIGIVFLAMFLVIGIATTALARRATRKRPDQPVALRGTSVSA